MANRAPLAPVRRGWTEVLRLTLAVSAIGSGSAAASGTFLERLEHELIAPIVAETPGAAVAVALGDEIVLKRSFGTRRYGHNEPVDDETLFRIASISKTFAAAAAAILISENALINWQTPVVSRLPIRFKREDYGQQINLRHLMSQSTGLMPHAYTNLIEDRMPYARMLKRLDRVEFICAPGRCYGYQNVVFSLIGDVIEVTTNASYPEFVAERIFKPLGMVRASYGIEAFIADDNHAEPHIRGGRQHGVRGGAWTTVRTTPHYYKVPPAAGVNASIDDMARWLLAHLGTTPGVLTSEMLDELHGKQVRTTRYQSHYPRRKRLGKVHYGLGWRVFEYGSLGSFVHHGGYVRGMRSEMVLNRSLGVGLVFLTNSEPLSLNELVFDFIDLYLVDQAGGGPSVEAGSD